MFGMLTDAIENVLTIGQKLITLELPSKREVATLIDAGVSIATIAATFGVAEDVIEKLLKE